jgi:glycine oxidase
MLAPVAEARAAEEPLARLGLVSLERWPAFAERLARDGAIDGTPADLGLREEGTLQVAFDDDDLRALRELAAVHRVLGLASEPVGSRDCRQLAPMLSPRIRGGLVVPGDWQVDPRRVLDALIRALVHRGGRLVTCAAAGLQRDAAGAVCGVELSDGTVLAARAVVLAAGAGARSALAGLPSGALPLVRPVKGEILRLGDNPAEPLLPLTVRASVRAQSVYLVPRRDGELVVGATMQEAGHDTTVRAGAVLDLLRAAIDLVPAVGELPLRESIARSRPATPDNAPILGPSSLPGLHFAVGHHRNGVLLTPVTADAVVAGITDGVLPEATAAFTAGRFS